MCDRSHEADRPGRDLRSQRKNGPDGDGQAKTAKDGAPTAGMAAGPVVAEADAGHVDAAAAGLDAVSTMEARLRGMDVCRQHCRGCVLYAV